MTGAHPYPWTTAAKGSFSNATPDSRIDAPHAPVESPQRQDRAVVFLSYRRDDSSDVTGRIYDRLVQRFGDKGVFKDVDSIPLGVDFRKHLGDSVGQCRILLVIIGKNWSANLKNPGKRPLDDPRDFVRIELETAIQRGIPVIPVLVQGAAVPAEDQLPTSLQPLAYHNGLAVRPDPDFHQDIARLIRGIEHHLGPG
jgi:TIR domain